MRLLLREQQQVVFKRLWNIEVAAARHDEDMDARDIIDDVLQIGAIVGGGEMVRALEGKR